VVVFHQNLYSYHLGRIWRVSWRCSKAATLSCCLTLFVSIPSSHPLAKSLRRAFKKNVSRRHASARGISATESQPCATPSTSPLLPRSQAGTLRRHSRQLVHPVTRTSALTPYWLRFGVSAIGAKSRRHCSGRRPQAHGFR
jgi:hypothetical protein